MFTIGPFEIDDQLYENIQAPYRTACDAFEKIGSVDFDVSYRLTIECTWNKVPIEAKVEIDNGQLTITCWIVAKDGCYIGDYL
jgi:hypothetical protein